MRNGRLPKDLEPNMSYVGQTSETVGLFFKTLLLDQFILSRCEYNSSKTDFINNVNRFNHPEKRYNILLWKLRSLLFFLLFYPIIIFFIDPKDLYICK